MKSSTTSISANFTGYFKLRTIELVIMFWSSKSKLWFGACCLQLAVSIKTLPQDVVIDKLKGMILLGALGDALGCPTEETCQSGDNYSNYSCSLQPYVSSSYHASEWGVWPNQSQIVGEYGVVTDDTSFRISLLEPWLLRDCSSALNASNFCDDSKISIKKTFQDLNESLFKIYINNTDSGLYNFENLDEINSNSNSNSNRNVKKLSEIAIKREKMLADFVVIMNDANLEPIIPVNMTHGNNPFYISGLPVVFGSYMYIELGGLIFNIYDIYNTTHWNYISNYTKLDTDYGHIYTGLLISLLAEALNTNTNTNPNTYTIKDMKENINIRYDEKIKNNNNISEVKSFGDWAYDTINEWYEWFDRNNFDINNDGYRILQNISSDSYYIGHNEWNLEKNYNMSQFILNSEKLYLYYENKENRQLYSEDPRVFWRQEWLTIGFCNNNNDNYNNNNNINDVACIMSSLMACAGDSDTVGSELALIVGAYYGYDYISSLSCDITQNDMCDTFNKQFDRIESFLNDWYEYNVTKQAELFYNRSRQFIG